MTTASPASTGLDPDEPPLGVLPSSEARPYDGYVDHARYLRLPKFFSSLATEQQTELLPFYAELTYNLFTSVHGPSRSSERFHWRYAWQATDSATILAARLRNGSHTFYNREQEKADDAMKAYTARTLKPAFWVAPVARGSRYCDDEDCPGVCKMLRVQEAQELRDLASQTSAADGVVAEHGCQVGTLCKDPPGYRRSIFLHARYDPSKRKLKVEFAISQWTEDGKWRHQRQQPRGLLVVPEMIEWRQELPGGLDTPDAATLIFNDLASKGGLHSRVSSLAAFEEHFSRWWSREQRNIALRSRQQTDDPPYRAEASKRLEAAATAADCRLDAAGAAHGAADGGSDTLRRGGRLLSSCSSQKRKRSSSTSQGPVGKRRHRGPLSTALSSPPRLTGTLAASTPHSQDLAASTAP